MRPLYENREDTLALETVCEHPFPLHIHESAELTVIEQGESEITVSGKSYTLRAGDCALVFPLMGHAYGEQRGTAGYTLFIAPETLPRYTDIFRGMQPECPVIRKEQMDPMFFTAYEKLKALYARGAEKDLLFAACAHTLLACAVTAAKPVNSEPYARQDLIFHVARYIADHCTENISLEDTAAALGYSASLISHLFKLRIGIGFRPYVNTLRIGKARNLLLTTQMRVTDICYACGYGNQRTFNRAFLEECGMPPAEWRKLHFGQLPENGSPEAPPEGSGKKLHDFL